jgi:glycogen(starch) synthase
MGPAVNRLLPRRVLMTGDAVGGVWEYTLELARGLGRHDVDVLLAVMGPVPDRQQRDAAAALPNLELVTAPYALEWMDEPWDDVAASGEWLLDLERRAGCDLVHLDGYAHGALPFRAPKLVVGHSCVVSWWEAVKGEAAPPRWDRYRRAVTAGLEAADRVVAPTAWMLNQLRLLYGPLPPAEVIHNGRRGDDHHPGEKRNFILGAGRLWDEAKGLRRLARVGAQLPWPVTIAGPTAPEGETVAPVSPNTRFVGKVSAAALRALYAEAAIYVSPGLYEPFGLTVLEAALSGCALVLSDLGSFRELWSDVALFVPPGDDQALAAVVLELVNSPMRRAGLGEAARRRARSYGEGPMIDRYLATYRSLLAGRTGQEERPPCAS